MWLCTLHSCRTISFGCLVSTGCFTRWWTSLLSYSALLTESSMVTGGTLKTSDDSGRLGTSLSTGGLQGESESLSLPPSLPSLSLSLSLFSPSSSSFICILFRSSISVLIVLPSHCCRHIYNPLIKSGYNKIAAQLIVFAMSAFFHEVLVL